MSKSLEERLKPIEAEVIKMVTDRGMRGTMLFYGIKSRQAFTVWLKIKKAKISFLSPVGSLSGGAKHKWLQDHKETLLDLADLLGEDWVITEFKLGVDTFERLRMHYDPTSHIKLSKSEKQSLLTSDLIKRVSKLEDQVSKLLLRIDVTEERSQNARREAEQLKRAYASFVNSTSDQVAKCLTKLIVQPLIQRSIHVDETEAAGLIELPSETNEIEELINECKTRLTKH